MTIQKRIGFISLFGLLTLSIMAAIACGGDTGVVPTAAPTATIPPEAATSTPEAAPPTDVPATPPEPTIESTSTPVPTHTPSPTETPTATPEPTGTPTAAPETTDTPTPIPSATPVIGTIINEYGFKLKLHGDVPIRVVGVAEKNPTSEQGTISFPYQGVAAILAWNSSASTAQQVVAINYNQLRDGQPSLTFETIKDGAIPVSGERGVFGAFKVLEGTDTAVGGGFVSAWICSESQTRYSLTVTGAQLTTVQIRFQDILTNFSCSS